MMGYPGLHNEEQHKALDAYWAAKTAAEERAAYARMMELGLPDAYGVRQPAPRLAWAVVIYVAVICGIFGAAAWLVTF
jgi:hypothetical protein